MTNAEIISLAITALVELGKLIASGVKHDVALARIKRLSEGAHVVDADIDAAVAPSDPSPR